MHLYVLGPCHWENIPVNGEAILARRELSLLLVMIAHFRRIPVSMPKELVRALKPVDQLREGRVAQLRKRGHAQEEAKQVSLFQDLSIVCLPNKVKAVPLPSPA